MQSERCYINSVSDLLYGTDEIEFLLDDIRDLEPTNCDPDDIQADAGVDDERMMMSGGVLLQDFEIAGSRTGGTTIGTNGCSGSGGGGAGGGGGDGDNCECECECACGARRTATDSPIGTVHSWDSHANYHHNLSASPDASLYSGVIVYCDHKHLKTPIGCIRVLLVISTIACLMCLCTSGTVKVGLFMLPLVGRLRFMMFVTLFTIFITIILLFLDISHIVYLFPFNWGKVNAWLYVSMSILFLVSSSLIFHLIFVSETFSWVPKWTHHQLLVTGCLGYVCCIECVLLTLLQKCTIASYEPVVQDPSLTLQERQPPLDDSPIKTALYPITTATTTSTSMHNYKPASNYHLASTSQPQNPGTNSNPVPNTIMTQNQIVVGTMMCRVDDVQPCSSKSIDPYRLA